MILASSYAHSTLGNDLAFFHQILFECSFISNCFEESGTSNIGLNLFFLIYHLVIYCSIFATVDGTYFIYEGYDWDGGFLCFL